MENKKAFDLKNTLKNIKKSWGFVKNKKKQLVLYSVFSIISCGISVVVPIVSAQMLVKLTDGLFTQLAFLTFLLFIIEINRNIFHFLGSKMNQIICISILTNIQTKVAEETLVLKSKELDNHSSGVFADRIGKDTYDMANIFTEITYAIADLFANIGILVAIFLLNKIVFIYSLIVMIIIFLGERIRMKKYYEIDKKWRKLNEKNTGLITELVRGIKDIKVLNANKTFMNKTAERIIDSNEKKYQMGDIQRIYRFWISNLKDLCDLGYVFLGIILASSSKITIPVFIMLYSYKNKVLNLLSYVVNCFEWVKKFDVATDRIFEIIDGEKFEKETFGTKHIKKVEGNFEFRNVNFSYNKKNKIINNLSFKIKPNETVAFVGKSGEGKTTIFSLLNKLYTIDSGEILIDGVNINELDKNSIRDNMSIISQNPYVFNFSIKENLKLVKPNVTDQEIEEACKIACLDSFIETLPDKYDTIVGEGGITLSGGQRQRLAIARALIKKTEIILFDEATSALDNETQKQIQNAINNMKGEYTILIIAHRLSTIINSDRIYLIKKGTVVAQGTHKELIKSNKLYKKLYETEII